MDGEAGWWTTSGNIGLPPLARVMGVGRQQQQHELFEKYMEIDDTQRETTRTHGDRVIKRPTYLDDYGEYVYFA